MAEGAPSKEIARQLNLSIHTVNAHLHGTYIKLRARNRLEAARWYWEQFGMQQPGQLAHLALGGDPPARAT
jgi:DNA-binding NarL/FixJ family response regulator